MKPNICTDCVSGPVIACVREVLLHVDEEGNGDCYRYIFTCDLGRRRECCFLAGYFFKVCPLARLHASKHTQQASRNTKVPTHVGAHNVSFIKV